jgi:hypothetical protein
MTQEFPEVRHAARRYRRKATRRRRSRSVDGGEPADDYLEQG